VITAAAAITGGLILGVALFAVVSVAVFTMVDDIDTLVSF
jgi:hypothetical protein